MSFRSLAGYLLLLIVTRFIITHGEYFQSNSSVYCALTTAILKQQIVTPNDFQSACDQRRQLDSNKLLQTFQAVQSHGNKQVNASVPVFETLKQFFGGIQLIPGPQRDPFIHVDVLRVRVMIAAIEAGRTSEALTQYILIQPFNNWHSIVDAIYQNTRRHPQHIENLLAFIRALPLRQERLEYYHYLKKYMVQHKDYESYLSAIFARDARSVVLAADGKTVLNQTDERALVSTMIDGAAGYFRRAFLVGDNRYDFIALDRDFPELFDMLYSKIFPITDIRKFNAWKMMEGLCAVHRPISKARLFREAGSLLLKHFKWSKQNEFYAPMLAAYLHDCMPQIQKDPQSRKMMDELRNMFDKFKDRTPYQVHLKVIGADKIHAFAG